MPNYNLSTENKSNVADHPKARELLRRASEKTYRWPNGFKGFSADLIIEEEDKVAKGRVEIRSAKDVKVTLDDEGLEKWAEGQIGMMAVHRMPRSFDESDGRYSLTLGEPDYHPFGQKVIINGDGMNSYYRVSEDRITQINRNMERIAFTINVEESLTTPDDKILSTRYTVYYFSPNDKRLTNTESYSDQPEVVDGVFLPGTRRISFAENQKVITRKVQFLNHKLF